MCFILFIILYLLRYILWIERLALSVVRFIQQLGQTILMMLCHHWISVQIIIIGLIV